jgi:RecB family endonuclease NucS
MMPLLKYLHRHSHNEVVSTVEEVLLGQGWVVHRDPTYGKMLRPDIVARGPGGETYVFEVKRSDGEVNLGAVAQVEAYRNAVAETDGGQVKGVLVIAGEAPEGLIPVAERVGIELVDAGSGDAGSVRDSLTRSGVIGEPAAPEPIAQRSRGA